MATTFALRRSPHLFRLAAGVSVSSLLIHQSQLHLPRVYADSLSPNTATTADWSYTRDAKTPVMTSDGKINKNMIRQISAGSIYGAISGVIIAYFSRTLVVVTGVLISVIVFAESKGIHVVPYGRLQKYFKNVDLRSLFEDDAALKVAFGTVFTIAGFV